MNSSRKDNFSFDENFNKALDFKNKNKHEEALSLFDKLKERKPNYYLIYIMIGDIYWEIGKLKEASEEFKKAVSLKPNSEKVSRAHFHVLWDQDKKIKALDEMKRFLKNNESEAYTEILKEINES